MPDVPTALVVALLSLPLAGPAVIAGWRLNRWVHDRTDRALRRWLGVPACDEGTPDADA